jgi:integrase
MTRKVWDGLWGERREERMAREPKSTKEGLSPALVELAKKGKLVAGRYSDGRGLMLLVEGGSARWVLRLTTGGKRRDLGLGSVKDVGLADARERAAEKIKDARAGRDPGARVKPLPFRDAAERVYELRKQGWKVDGKHVDQWWDTLEAFVLPTFGTKNVGDVEPGDMLDVLTPIWLAKPETARRVRQRCGLVFDWATTKGHRSALLQNPAEVVVAALPRQEDEVEHHPAVQWRHAPEFLVAVRDSKAQEGTRLALELLLLTAARTAEVIYAEWSEIDIEGRTWTVPAARMKRKRDHRVALSDQAIAVLQTARARWPNSKLVFCGRWPGEALSNQALLMLMRRLGFKDDAGRTAVPHGCRSTFRDWCADNGKDDNAAELALSHAVGSKTVRSYKRTDLLDPRRLVMQEWANYVTRKAAEPAKSPHQAEATAAEEHAHA